MSKTPEIVRATRFMAGLPASFTVSGREVSCTAHNLSRTGVLLIGEIPSFSEDEISLTIRHPSGDLRFSTTGRVLRRDVGTEKSSSTLGVEFLGVHPDELPELEALISRVIEGGSPAVLETLPAGASVREIREALEQIPLPHRITLAVRARPKERETLIHDTHPNVLDGLARNPGLLPHEAMTLLRMPNLLPQTLEAMSRDSRWTGSQQTALMIATHRNTPQGPANQMVLKMPASWLERVIAASGLKPALRTTVLRRLKR